MAPHHTLGRHTTVTPQVRLKELLKYRDHGLMAVEHLPAFERERFRREIRRRARWACLYHTIPCSTECSTPTSYQCPTTPVYYYTHQW